MKSDSFQHLNEIKCFLCISSSSSESTVRLSEELLVFIGYFSFAWFLDITHAAASQIHVHESVQFLLDM